MRKIDRIVTTERDLREQVRDLCKLYGWRMQFTWSSIHSPAGFPDLVLVSLERKRVIFAELKREGKDPTPAQSEWLGELKACGQEVYIWRPTDIEAIAEILR